MKNALQRNFPMIRTRAEVLKEIQGQPELSHIYDSWKPEQQQLFLDYVTGIKGVKVLYDSFFKEIMNPETTPERLEEFLSLIFRQTVKIKRILPTDNSRIADENSLLIMDILIEMEDGSLANIEVQKIGYKFPGQRCACYSADLLLRQYKRVRSEKGNSFSYKDIKKVYTIVLFEKSTGEFHKYPHDDLHWIRPKSNTGIEIELLQEYILIPLDIFRENLQNKGIENTLDAWLTFLSVDEPEMIEKLIQHYPQFIPMYQQIYDICRNIERVMGLYSEELKILDRNTVQLMIDEMQEEIDGQKIILSLKDEQLSQQERRLSQQEQQLSQQEQQLSQQEQQLHALNQELEELKLRLAES